MAFTRPCPNPPFYYGIHLTSLQQGIIAKGAQITAMVACPSAVAMPLLPCAGARQAPCSQGPLSPAGSIPMQPVPSRPPSHSPIIHTATQPSFFLTRPGCAVRCLREGSSRCDKMQACFSGRTLAAGAQAPAAGPSRPVLCSMHTVPYRRARHCIGQGSPRILSSLGAAAGSPAGGHTDDVLICHIKRIACH